MSVFLPNSPLRSPGQLHCVSQVTVVALSGLFLLTVLGAALALQKAAPLPPAARAIETDGLFNPTNTWSVHLKFSPEQWAAMEPKGGRFGLGGPEGGSGGRPPGPPGGFGPGMLIAPLFLSNGDQNRDGSLSRNEFTGLAEKWFGTWDTNRTGNLDLNEIGMGINPPRGPGATAFPTNRMAGPRFQAPEGKRNGMAGMMGTDYQYAHADLDFEGLQFPNASVRYKGNNTFMSSRNSLKRPLKIDLDKGYRGRKLGGVTKFNLHNSVNDPSWMNEVLSYRLYRDAGVPAPRTTYARVYVTVPGQYDKEYLGLYSLVENVDNDFLRAHFGTRRGAIFKPATRQVFEDMGDSWTAYRQTYDPKTTLLEDQAQRVIDFSKLVSHASDPVFASRLEEFLDLDEFTRFMAVTVWLSTMDSILSMGQNFIVYLHPRTQQFQFLPWDLDHSFGQFPMAGSQEQLENLSIHRPWSGQNLFLQRVFKVDKFKGLYLARLREFSGTIFKPGLFNLQVSELAQVLRPAVTEESAEKLERFDKVIAGQSVAGMGPGGEPAGPRVRVQTQGARRFGPPGGFQARKPIKSFVVARAKSVNEQLAGKNEGETLVQFGPPGGPGRPGGPRGPGGPGGGPAMFNPGQLLAKSVSDAFDTAKDGVITREEFTSGFAKWFDDWAAETGALTEERLRAGINKDLSPFRGGPPPGFNGPPPGFNGPPPFEPDTP